MVLLVACILSVVNLENSAIILIKGGAFHSDFELSCSAAQTIEESEDIQKCYRQMKDDPYFCLLQNPV